MKIYLRNGKFWLDYRDQHGKRVRVSTKTSVRSEAHAVMAERIQAVKLAKIGKDDPHALECAQAAGVAMAQHIADYETHKLNAGKADRYVQQVVKILKTFSKDHGIKVLSDITLTRADDYLANMRKAGLATSTINWNIAALRSFCAYAITAKKTKVNPLHELKKQAERAAPTRRRRALSDQELLTLISHVERLQEPCKRKATPAKRAALYALAAYSGFRKGELCILTKGDLQLGDNPALRLEASESKNGKEARQPIDPSVAAFVKQVAEAAKEDEKIFDGCYHNCTKLFKEDIAAARDAWIAAGGKQAAARAASDFLKGRDRAGDVINFHALRHTFITRAARHHPIHVVKELARHSNIKQTEKYMHATKDEVLAAVPAMVMPKVMRKKAPKQPGARRHNEP